MKSIDVLDQFTVLDRKRLGGKDEHIYYFEYIKDAFSLLMQSMDERTSEHPKEVSIIHGFIQKFLNSIEALRLKYGVADDDSLLIDVTDSSFPNYMEIKKLRSDIENKEERIKELPEQEKLKRKTLDHLFKHHAVPDGLMKQISMRKYYEYIDESKLFLEYNIGALVHLNTTKPNLHERYLYSWSTYDSVSNKPYVYILIFDHNDRHENSLKNSATKRAFEKQIELLTQNIAPLRVLASDIDHTFEKMHPKILKRIELGPIYGKYSEDENYFSKLVHEQLSEKDFAMFFTTEIIFSVGSKKQSSFLSKGEIRQIFFIDESNRDCIERHVSKVHQYMIASHALVQQVRAENNTMLDDLALPPITFTKIKEGIYGKK